eukprot:6214243-Pleurochrysis_carterae.AAC.1
MTQTSLKDSVAGRKPKAAQARLRLKRAFTCRLAGACVHSHMNGFSSLHAHGCRHVRPQDNAHTRRQ